MAELSLKDLMDPKRQELQARYTNAQFAVDLAYRIARDSFYPDSVRTLDEAASEAAGEPRYLYTDPSLEQKVEAYVKAARILKAEIEKDLNDTLKVLEVVEDGAKTDAAKLS